MSPGFAQQVSHTPTPPAWISVDRSNSSDGVFTVTWAQSSGASSYRLRERFGGAWTDIALSDGGISRSWTPTPPKNLSGEYSYSIAACNAPGNCSSDTVGAVVIVTLPVTVSVPTNLKACGTGADAGACAAAGDTLELVGSNVNYRVSWDAVANATSYQFQRTVRTASHPAEQTEAVQTVYVAYVEGGGNPVSDGGWYQHRYRVRACAGSNCSGWTWPEAKVRADANPVRLTATGTLYYHTDALGSPVAQTDASGAVIKRMAYQPWGVPAAGSYEQGPGYTGHVTDALTGLSYMQQRYYDPIAGRFLSVDPVAASEVSFNRYWYANNNPYKYIDPDGRCPKSLGSNICIESTVKLKGDRADVKLDERGSEYATSTSGTSSVNSKGLNEERFKAVVDSKGKLFSRDLGNVTKKESDAGYSAKGDPPEGTVFIMHGHVNPTMVDQPGLGDSQPLLDAGLPNVTVTGENRPRIGVREIEGNRLQHKMLRGTMTSNEIRDIQNHMDQAARLYNER